MRTLTKDDSLDRRGPRPRKPIHSSIMYPVRRSPRQHQNEKYASAENLVSEDDMLSDDMNEQYEEVNVEDRENPNQTDRNAQYGWMHEFKHPDESLSPRSYLSKSDDTSRDYNKSSSQGNPNKQKSHKKSDIQQNNLTFIQVIMGVVVVAILFWCCSGNTDDSQWRQSEREENLAREIKHIREEFPSQLKKIWVEFSAGIKKVEENPNRPSVFLLLHEADEETSACLAHKIGNIATQFLNADIPVPLVLDGIELENNKTLVEDYGTLIEENRPKMEERRTMIVKNLHKIPAVVAQSFHSFCDTVTPLVDKAVYLFIMKAKGVYHPSNNPTELAEKELNKLWNKHLSEDILSPLVVRITDRVMFVMPENDLNSCGR